MRAMPLKLAFSKNPPNNGGPMLRKVVSAAATVLVAASLIWAANDPWKSKPYDQWDDKDIHRIFNDSPWSKVVQITSSSPSTAPSDSGMPAASSSAGSSQPARGMGGGGQYPQSPQSSGGYPSSQPSPAAATPFVVRWVSSRTIREAAIRSAVLKGQLKPEDASKDLQQPVDMYQVLVAGPNMKAFQSADEGNLKNSTFLETKRTKEKLTPSDIKIQRGADGSIESVVFLFPKKASSGEPTITPNEKGADFATSVGGVKINTSFDFSKMEDTQGRDL
jgi:hypothetical protein